MIYIGDVHGKFKELQKIIEQHPDQPIIQVGDLGIGFGRYPHDFGPNFHFIRGNHDNPKTCRSHTNYLCDFGVTAKFPNIFCVSGAYSIDKAYRTPGPIRLMRIPYSQELADEICEYLGILSTTSTSWHDFLEYMRSWSYYCYNGQKMNGRFLETHEDYRERMSFLISSYLISRFADKK